MTEIWRRDDESLAAPSRRRDAWKAMIISTASSLIVSWRHQVERLFSAET